MREAEAHALKLSRSCALRHGHDKHSDDGGSFALHTRRFSTDFESVTSRHANTKGDRVRHSQYHAIGNNLKSDCVANGMGRFAGRSRNLP